jgi:hypothetical protein
VTADIVFDAEDVRVLSSAIAGLPDHIHARAFSRAMRRINEMVRTQIVDRSAERIKVQKRVVRSRTTATFNAGSNTIDAVVYAGWIPLYQLGARQTARGVYVRTRGSYRSAFIATMKSGHTGVFKRAPGTIMRGKNKQAIRELHGPNPANDITNNPEVFLQVLAKVIEDHLAPRVLHEIDRHLRRMDR